MPSSTAAYSEPGGTLNATRSSDEGVRGRIRLALVAGRFNLLVGLIIAAGTAAVILIGVAHVRADLLTLGDLLLVMGYVSKLYEPIKTIETAGIADRALELGPVPLRIDRCARQHVDGAARRLAPQVAVVVVDIDGRARVGTVGEGEQHGLVFLVSDEVRLLLVEAHCHPGDHGGRVPRP